MQYQMSQKCGMPVQNSCEQVLLMPECAHAYVPFQNLNSVFDPCKGLCNGTIFPELSRPYGLDPEYTVDA